MLRIIGRRILIAIPILFAALFVTTVMSRLIPGDPAVTILGQSATPEAVARIRAELGLDRGILEEYWHWLQGIVRGDFGHSLFTPESGIDVIVRRLPVTLSLAAVALTIALAVSVVSAIAACWKPMSWFDRFANSASSVGLAIPNFWLGSLLVYFLALQFGLFPPSGYVPISEGVAPWLRSLVLPATALAVPVSAEMFRQLRTALGTALSQDYVKTAYSKGISKFLVIAKHALKTAAAPMVTVLGFHAAALLGGSVIIERIFALPGFGGLAANAVLNQDIPMVQVVVLIAAVLVQLTNLIVDVSYGWLDPRVRA